MSVPVSTGVFLLADVVRAAAAELLDQPLGSQEDATCGNHDQRGLALAARGAVLARGAVESVHRHEGTPNLKRCVADLRCKKYHIMNTSKTKPLTGRRGCLYKVE